MHNLTIKTIESDSEALGRIISICIGQRSYLDWSIEDLERLFIPPISHKQYRIFQDGSQDAGFFTWAKLSKDASDFIIKYGADPRYYEWQSGPYLWIIDMVADSRIAAQMALNIQRKVFTPNFIKEIGIDAGVRVRALRRNPDKTIRKVAYFNLKN